MDKYIGRVVLKQNPNELTDRQRESMLLEILSSRWSTNLHVKFLITPGGFTCASFPSIWNGSSGWNSTADDLGLLLPYAEDALWRVLTDRVFEAAKQKVDILTVGLDLGGNPPSKHAELVAVCEVYGQAVGTPVALRAPCVPTVLIKGGESILNTPVFCLDNR